MHATPSRPSAYYPSSAKLLQKESRVMSLRAQQQVLNTRKSRKISSRAGSAASRPSLSKLHFCSSRMLFLILLAALTTSMLLLAKFMNDSISAWEIPNFTISLQPGVSPFDLSVNNLHAIKRAPGALKRDLQTEEDFLPVTGSLPIFRFRLKPIAGASHTAIQDISAYRIRCVMAHDENRTLWDSGKVLSKNGMPTNIQWGGEQLIVGTIVKWKVQVWDFAGAGPATSDWHKFAAGPTNNKHWEGQWITHPTDLHSFKNATNLWQRGVTLTYCRDWEKRADLPIMRTEFTLDKPISSALLVVSGLGSFHAMLDGNELSSSSILDPPLTDFTERVSYRGYDITKMMHDTKSSAHVLSILLGSAWWDSRPLTSSIVKLNLMPRGSLTCVAQIHVLYNDGTSETVAPTSPLHWQTRRGYLRESGLFTGEVMDIGMQHTDLKGWNTVNDDSIGWVAPEVYESSITREQWRQDLSENSKAKQQRAAEEGHLQFAVAPIGKLVPYEAPPVMPVERIPPQSIVNLGSGRWLFDFGKGMSGVLRFDEGLPNPIVPDNYPRGHTVFTRSDDEAFITVVYGDSLELKTGDINLNIVAGMGLREAGHKNVPGMAGPCFPKDHDKGLLQRDVYIAPNQDSMFFANARQPLFTSHGFRFAEICCTKEPPKSLSAIAYRTAFPEWGKFDSSNVLLNGAYEMTRNALGSNMLGTQTDCPHRERFQYGGDLVADSSAAMHFFDLSSFYSKIIHDWMDTQWDNGAYTETSPWQDLNDYAGIGHGAGETVWASLPAVLTVRHAQNYGDMKLIEESFQYHVQWLEFLKAKWEEGMTKLFYNEVGRNLEKYSGNKGGLGDWLSLLSRDTWLTHNTFFMATARCVAYLAAKLGEETIKGDSVGIANEIIGSINRLYMKDDDDAFRMKRTLDLTPGPEIALFARIVPGKRRCSVVREWMKLAASKEPIYDSLGNEEAAFLRQVNKDDLQELIKLGIVEQSTDGKIQMLWKRGSNMPEGILAVRYNLKALSQFGFHHVALDKAAGIGYPGFEYMMSHNATTLWETWYRSEEIFSRNHPMLGAVAEWLSSSVAGVELDPKTVGGRHLLFWPQIPTSTRHLQFASSIQGTKRGDASIAWEFLDVHESEVVIVHIRILVPPSSSARFIIPGLKNISKVAISFAARIPDLDMVRKLADKECAKRRNEGRGFNYNWEFDRTKQEYKKVGRKKAIGTPCASFLFDTNLKGTHWSSPEYVRLERNEQNELVLSPGLYDISIDNWKLTKGDVAKTIDPDVYCSDSNTVSWDIDDATHII